MEDQKTRNRNVFYVGLLSFFGGISQDVFGPVLPIYLTSVLGFDKAFIGIAEGVVTASVNIAKVVGGYLSDRFHRQKPLIFLGYLASMLGRAVLALVGGAAPVIGLRLLDGAGKGLKDPPKDVLIAGSSAQSVRGRSFGLARMLDTLGSVAGPLILFVLLYFLRDTASLYHYILLFSAVPLLITLVVLVLKIRELPQPAAPQGIAPAKERLSGPFYIFLAIVMIFTLGNSSDAFLILRARSLGVTLLQIPLVIAVFNLIYALAAVPFGSLSDRIGRIPTIAIGWASYALVYLGFALADGPAAVWVLYGFYGLYYATNEGVAKAFLADMVGPDHRGRAFGIYGTVIGVTTLPASFLAGFLWDRFGAPVPFYFGSALAMLSAVILLAFSGRLKNFMKFS